MFDTDHPTGADTLEEIYRTPDRAGLPETLRERLVGGTAVKFVERFWPDFTTRIPKKARA